MREKLDVPERSGRPALLGIGLLALAITGAALFYPRLATSIYRIATGGRGWDGSGLVYMQLVIVMPFAAAILVGAIVAYWLAGRRGGTKRGLVVMGAWVVALVALAASIAWYGSQAG
jgi:hypothetical protein